MNRIPLLQKTHTHTEQQFTPQTTIMAFDVRSSKQSGTGHVFPVATPCTFLQKYVGPKGSFPGLLTLTLSKTTFCMGLVSLA
mmetsp:Transcript_76918/g.152267  ORF Transcript_76918/g.152267 Transcript_76918/m.152267 type:complete len:82 (-) Transcript_76918:1160-1405(-)